MDIPKLIFKWQATQTLDSLSQHQEKVEIQGSNVFSSEFTVTKVWLNVPFVFNRYLVLLETCFASQY